MFFAPPRIILASPSTQRVRVQAAQPAFEDEASAFQRLIAEHRGIIVKVAASYTRSAEDRADLAQEIALQLWRAWPSYDSHRPFPTWMYRIALNVAISRQRSERHRDRPEVLGDEHEQMVGAHDVDAEARDQLALVQRAMQSLGSLDRALLLLQLEGCSQQETGDVLGITAGNVATRLGRIRQQLRRIAGAANPAGDTDGNA